MDGSYYEYEEDGAYCYPGTRVLRNRLGIRDAGTLASAERDFSSLRAAAIDKGDANIAETFDSDYLRAIHRYLFGDVYDWAGEYRTVNISKGSVFCMWPYIGEQLDALFGMLAGEGLLEGLPPEAMAARLAFYLGEINAIHPFREGNGRAQRAFVSSPPSGTATCSRSPECRTLRWWRRRSGRSTAITGSWRASWRAA